MEISLSGMEIIALQKFLSTLQWDDVTALVVLGVLSCFYFANQILFNRKPKGYHLMFVSPQIEDGLAPRNTNGKKKKAETRNIVEKLNQKVSIGIPLREGNI
jgi:hypothetical protein